jgi:putative ABC transport system permease protein
MIPNIAWRNIWRNLSRSFVVIIAVALGIWAGLFLISFSLGMADGRARDMIEKELSHIQVHNPAYKNDCEIKVSATIPNGEYLMKKSREYPYVRATSGRVLSLGMCASAKGDAGVLINGIYPDSENQLTQLKSKLVEGDYLDENRRSPILISRRMADKLKVELGKKIVLTFQDTDNNITAGAFRVAGLYQTYNNKYDDLQVFVRAEDLQRLLKLEGQIHEIGILMADRKEVAPVKTELQSSNPDLLVEDWLDLAPDLKLMDESFDAYMRVFLIIIMLALAFGIINTMLMAVMERTHELGMLMAIGMNRIRVFSMIMLETLLLSLVGVPLGLLMALGTVSYFEKNGIDMSVFAKGLSSLGYDSMIYTTLDSRYYVEIALMVFFTALISAIYPAYKALKLKPVEAMRSI